MLRLAGEVADGVMLWLCNPEYIREVVMPEVSAGREGAGRTLEGFEVVAAVPSAVVDDTGPALAAMRRDLLTYFGLPFYRAMLERSGFGEDIAAYDEAAARGDGEAMQAAISDRFLHALCAIGSPDDVRAGLARYMDAGAAAPCVGPIAKTDFEATRCGWRRPRSRGSWAGRPRRACRSAWRLQHRRGKGVGGGSGRGSSSSTGAVLPSGRPATVGQDGSRGTGRTAPGARGSASACGFGHEGRVFRNSPLETQGGGPLTATMAV